MAKTALSWLTDSEGVHHPLGPSNFPGWAHCTHFKSSPVPRDDINHPANRGTLKHIAFESQLCRGYIPKEITEELDCDEMDGLQWAMDWVEEYVPAERYHEEKVCCINDDFEEVYTGTLDLRWIDKQGCLHILDLKTGEERDYLMQLMGYATPAMEAHGHKMCVVHTLNTRYKKHTTEVVHRKESREQVMALLDDVVNGECDPVPCDYCAWCLDQAGCPSLVEAAVKVVDGYVDDAPTLDLANYHSSQVSDPVIMGKMYQLAGILEKWAKSVKKHASDLAIKEGVDVPGTKIISKQGGQTITDMNAAFNLSGLDAEVFMSACKCSIPDLATAYHENLNAGLEEGEKGISKAVARKELEAKLSSVIKRGNSSKYLKKG